MIVGHGDIASVIVDTGKLFFASGVSNSAETRKEEFDREVRLLMDQDPEEHLVYFSSLSVFYSDTPYANHKRNMEGFVQARKSYTIVRLGNITWGTNPRTLLNVLRTKILHKDPYEVQPVYRYVVSQDEFQHWMALIPWWNCEMNIPGERLLVQQIVDRILRGEL